MFKVGITGGIGSGKSAVCAMLEEMGMPIFYSDIESHNVLNTDQEVQESIIDLLGPEAYVGGVLNRKWVGNTVFSDPDKLSRLNAIVVPAVKERFEKFVAWCSEQNADMAGIESAILTQVDGHKTVDHTIVVTAPLEVRIERAMKRDGVRREQVLLRIAAQASDEEVAKHADTLIVNDGNMESLQEQVAAAYEHLKRQRG